MYSFSQYKHRRYSIALVSTVCSIAVFCSALSAQTIEEVIVTAQKREEGVNDVPIAITALSASTVSDLGLRSMEDMAMSTPGLVVNQTSGTGAPAWTIRGVGFQDYSAAASSTVGIYFDEVAYPYPVMATGQFFDVERIEVLKGPQGDLYGRNTTGGQVGFISRKPTDEFEAGVSLSFGRFSHLEGEGYVSGPLSDDVRGRIAFKTVQRFEGWQKSLSRPGDELGEVETYSVRGIVDWDITPDLTASLNVHYNDDQSDGIASTPVQGELLGLGRTLRGSGTPFDDATIYRTGDNEAADWTNGPGNALRPKRDNQLFGFNLKMNWDIGNFTITSVTGYDKFERDEANDWDGSDLLDSSNINVTDIEVFSQELRIASTIGENISWLAGLYYSFDDIDEDYNYFFGEGIFGIAQLDTNYRVETDSIAAFAHAEWDINEQFGVNVGARFTSEDREFDGCTNDASPPDLAVPGLNLRDFLVLVLPPFISQIDPNACGVLDLETFTIPDTLLAEVSANEWMWKAGVDYRPTDDILTYFNVSKGFKSGGFNGANLNTVQQLGPYDIEELTSFEVGVKATLLDGTMQLNGSFFYYDYENKQERGRAVTPVGIISGLVNIPESEVYGAEAQLLWYPTDRWSIDTSVSWLDTEIKEYDAVQASSTLTNIVTSDASGLDVANAPKWSGNITMGYEFPLSNGLVLRPAFDIIYRDAVAGAPFQPEQGREDYTLVNARVGLYSSANDRWNITAWSRNLFDRDYYVSAFGGGNVWFVRTNGMPRTFGMSIDYRFD